MAAELASPIRPSETGASWPFNATCTGCATSPTQGRDENTKPSAVTATRATSSRTRKTPVISAFVLTLRIAHSVVSRTQPSPSNTGECPGNTVATNWPSPSATTAMLSSSATRLTPRMMKPGSGPSVRATIAYSPPATGNAEDSSA